MGYERKKELFIEPPLCTPAHVEFDLTDAAVFYVSCHNMSKYKGYMVLHGPGAIVKYKYKNGRVEELGLFSDADFNRITTHRIFSCQGESFIAITGYPNHLYIIRTSDMTLVAKYKLFDEESPVIYGEGIYICSGNKNAPLYLQVNSAGTKIYLVNSDTCFLVEWLTGQIENFKYTNRNYAVSAHMEIIE